MGSPSDLPLSVTLTMDEQVRSQLTRAPGLVEAAEAYVIDCPQMAEIANTELRNVIAFKKQLVEFRKGFVAPAKQIIANAEALFDAPIEAAERAEGIYKQRLSGWTQEQERIAAEARRKAEEEERKLRAEAEARAAAERARAEEEAAAKRRQAQEAEERRKKAEAEGNARAAAAAAAERDRREQEARSKIEAGEAKANNTILAAAATAPATVAPEATKVSGFSMRKNWIAEDEPGKTEDELTLMIVKAIAGGRAELLSLLKRDKVAANKLAKALESNFNVPGMKARNAPVAASRAA